MTVTVQQNLLRAGIQRQLQAGSELFKQHAGIGDNARALLLFASEQRWRVLSDSGETTRFAEDDLPARGSGIVQRLRVELRLRAGFGEQTF